MIQTWTFTKALLKLEPDVIIFAVLTNFTAFFSEKKLFTYLILIAALWDIADSL